VHDHSFENFSRIRRPGVMRAKQWVGLYRDAGKDRDKQIVAFVSACDPA